MPASKERPKAAKEIASLASKFPRIAPVLERGRRIFRNHNDTREDMVRGDEAGRKKSREGRVGPSPRLLNMKNQFK